MFGSFDKSVCRFDMDGSRFESVGLFLFCGFVSLVFKDFGGEGYLGWCRKFLLLFM